jgi:hypothetical protein
MKPGMLQSAPDRRTHPDVNRQVSETNSGERTGGRFSRATNVLTDSWLRGDQRATLISPLRVDVLEAQAATGQ